MTPLDTLLDRGVGDVLGSDLRALYGGGLAFPDAPARRPYAFSNAVTTIECLTSFGIPGHAGGTEISEGNPQDRFVVGLLRALADAVLVGAGTLRAERGHLWTPSFLFPECASLYADLRERLGKPSPNPVTIFVTGSGNVLPGESVPDTFLQPGIENAILTTEEGRDRAERQLAGVPAPRFLTFGERETVDLAAAFEHLRRSVGVRLLLVEGGATLNGAVVDADLLDEIFLTVSPLLIGTAEAYPRPLFAEGFARTPRTAVRQHLVSVKSAGDYLFKRYARRPAR